MTQVDRTRERLIETYRKKAKHYDVTSRLYPAPGYPQRAQRLQAVRALGLRPGDTVVDMACGTGLNFRLLEKVVGPGGRIVGVDLTDAMLARAQDRIQTNGWSNVSLVQADAAGFDFPAGVNAILSTYAMTQVPECAEVIAHGAKALSGGGRWAVLDLKVPGNTPGWLAQLGTAIVRPFASIDEWIMRRPWEAIRAAMQEELADFSWTELFFGTAFLAAGSRGRSEKRLSGGAGRLWRGAEVEGLRLVGQRRNGGGHGLARLLEPEPGEVEGSGAAEQRAEQDDPGLVRDVEHNGGLDMTPLGTGRRARRQTAPLSPW